MPDSETDRQPVQRGVPPVVLMFQPTTYEVVAPERLQEWQRTVAQGLGLQVGVDEANMRGIPSWCGCPEFDDCDNVGSPA